MGASPPSGNASAFEVGRVQKNTAEKENCKESNYYLEKLDTDALKAENRGATQTLVAVVGGCAKGFIASSGLSS